jgi:hypothetical protein
MMDNDTWLNADLALENKFADEIYTPAPPRAAAQRDADFLAGLAKTPQNKRFQFFNHHKENVTMNKIIQLIRNWLGLSPTDNLDEGQLAELIGAQITTVDNEVRQLKAEKQELADRIAAFESEAVTRRAQEVEDLLNDAESDGRLLPADRAAWVSYFNKDYTQAAKDLSAREPHTIVVKAVDPPPAKAGANESQLSRVTEEIRKQMK